MATLKEWKINAPENANIRFALSYPRRYYQRRLKKIGFYGKNTKLLDAGCGAGHWSAAASHLNKEVHGIDATEKYLAVARKITKSLKIGQHANLKLKIGQLESLPYPDEYFDFIVCYNTWMYTNRAKSLAEMFRVLRPGGKVYLGCVAGLGWYLNLIFQAIKENKRYLFFDSLRAIKRKIPVPERETRFLLGKQGLKLIDFGSDAQIGQKTIKVKPAYNAKFLGFWNVYEILAEKISTKVQK